MMFIYCALRINHQTFTATIGSTKHSLFGQVSKFVLAAHDIGSHIVHINKGTRLHIRFNHSPANHIWSFLLCLISWLT